MIILFRLPPEALVLLIPSLVFALSFHEYAHAWMAYKCGDNTAARLGRLSMNPIAHLDPMGSLMILFVGFGWAKPVPVDSRQLSKPRTDMMKVAAAGPLANLILAFVSGLILRIFSPIGLLTDSITVLIYYFTRINITLAVFNMIPVAPLDGSQIFSGYLMKHNRLQKILSLFVLISLVTCNIMSPFVNFNVSFQDCKWDF